MALRILLVDDNSEFRRHARRLLELDGLEIVGEATDAASALKSARRLRPDVVLLDVGLPDTSGLQIVDQLCPPGSPGPAIVLISTHTAHDLGPLLQRSNARGFIAKHELAGSRIEALAG